MFKTDAHKLARKTNHETSKEAARLFNSETMEELVYNDICSYGDKGCIIDDIIKNHPDIPLNSLSPRVAQLCHKKLVMYTGEKRKSSYNRNQMIIIKFNPELFYKDIESLEDLFD